MLLTPLVIINFLADAPSPFLLRLRCSRRICPGIYLAERELWLAISRLLWAYDIRSLPDEPISLEEYNGEHGRAPLPYPSLSHQDTIEFRCCWKRSSRKSV